MRIRTVSIGRQTSDGPQETWLRELEDRIEKDLSSKYVLHSYAEKPPNGNAKPT